MDVADPRSSSNDLSSAPNSDIERPNSDRYSSLPNSDTIVLSTTPPASNNAPAALGNGRQEPTVPKTRKPRKKKEDSAAPVEKEKKPRKPRAAASSGPASRKRIKTENAEITTNIQPAPQTNHFPASQTSHQATFPVNAAIAAAPEAAKTSLNGLSNQHLGAQVPSPMMTTSPPIQQQTHSPQIQALQPRSKPIFDPIRGVIVDRSVPTPPAAVPAATHATRPQSTWNPSTSPAISSIINPPDPPVPITNAANFIANPAVNSVPVSMLNNTLPTKDENAMEIDPPTVQQEKKPETNLAKPSSKPRAKEQPPPLPTGSGLLSSALFGGDSGVDAKSDGEKGPNIVLHIDLKNPNNKVINFARMAEEKYGFAALYPRQAAQKERLAKVAAAGAALERAASGAKGGTSASDSADEDLSVDIDRDSDNDGDANMSGVNGKGDVANSGTDGAAPRKRRKRKDEYDADDPFVDDSEMLWEAQAAASKDGFFVYIGPLVPEGEKPAVERADGTVKRGRGRGRGGGPGSRGGRGGANAVQGEGASGRGGGPGSRGGGVTRKPRITKAERQQRDLEKKQKEQMAVLAAKPPLVPT